MRKVTTGQSYINNKLFTASSAAERKLCANADWLSKGNAALGDGGLKGISQAVTDIWNQSMSASPIGKLFPEPGKKSGPGIGNTVMEITERVIKEQEQRKEQERIWESRYELRYGASDAERNGAFSENGIEDLLKRAQITEDSLGYETVLVVSEVDKTQWLFPVTTTIEGDVNGTKEVHNPYEVWGAPGKGNYKYRPMKDDEGNYIVCVGPKVLDFYYADSGKLWESEIEHRYLTILLENEKTGEQISKNCYVLTNKAHTYNTYPDGHENSTLGEARFDIDSGWFQTGISYPNSYNASGSAALAPDNVDGSIIEFATDKLDFNPSDYRLLQITIVTGR